MRNVTKGRIVQGVAIAIDVGFPLAAVFSQFPLWVDKSAAATMSGLFVIMAFMACIPFIKQIKTWLKSPAIWTVWLVLLVLFIALRAIIDEMLIVCFIGTLANCLGAGIYKLGEFLKQKPDSKTDP